MPFFRIIIPLILGIIVQYKLFAIEINALFFILPLFISLFVLYRSKMHQFYSWTWLYGFHYYMILFFTGIYMIQLRPLKSGIPLGEKQYFELLVETNPEQSAKSLIVDVKIRGFSADGKLWNKCNEWSVAYMDNDSTTVLSPGDVFICEAIFNAVTPPQNPEEFNYKKYLERREIFSIAYINSDKLAVVDSGRINRYERFIFDLQKYAQKTLSNAGLGKEELSVALALLIGNRQYVDDDLLQSYVSSGSVHLLAVSGLHVGIVFMILNFVLQSMNRSKKLRIIKGLIILCSLWIYASIAGLASSIVRASIMFSVFVVADMINKPKNTYNNIALSCLIICISNPYVIFDTGFQLSYLAVLGIVYFQPKFMKLIPSRNAFVQAVAGCVTVTLAAQLGTLPVILYIFKSFPAYFIFSNLLLVPYTTVVMYVGVAVIALSWSPLLLSLSGTAFDYCLFLMNYIPKIFSGLPYSVIGGIYINGPQCALLVIGIMSFAAILSFGKRWLFMPFLISLTGIFAIGTSHSYSISSQSECGLFGVRNAFYAYFIRDNTGFYVRDTASAGKSFDFSTKNYLIKKGFTSERDLTGLSLSDSIPNSYKGIISFAGLKIALLSQLEINPEFTGVPFKLDYLYITGATDTTPEATLRCYSPDKIIIAGNVPVRQINEWTALAESKKIAYHNVKTDGFWNLNYE
jgi:competence protein ComEC